MVRGRKPLEKPLLWSPHVIDVFGPVYVESLLKSDWPMHRTIEALASIEDIRPSKTDIAFGQNLVTRWAMSDVIRRKWNPKMSPAYLGVKLNRDTSKLVKLEGLMLTKLLQLVSEVFLIAPSGYKHPATWWGLCCVEGCSMRRLKHSSEDWATTKKQSLREFEGITAALRKRENPFQLSHSRKLFDLAVTMAEAGTGSTADKDSFYARGYKPFLDARAETAKYLRGKKVQIINRSK